MEGNVMPVPPCGGTLQDQDQDQDRDQDQDQDQATAPSAAAITRWSLQLCTGVRIRGSFFFFFSFLRDDHDVSLASSRVPIPAS